MYMIHFLKYLEISEICGRAQVKQCHLLKYKARQFPLWCAQCPSGKHNAGEVRLKANLNHLLIYVSLIRAWLVSGMSTIKGGRGVCETVSYGLLLKNFYWSWITILQYSKRSSCK